MDKIHFTEYNTNDSGLITGQFPKP